jgi:uncharacterized repeat protein (TIGR01451 family)
MSLYKKIFLYCVVASASVCLLHSFAAGQTKAGSRVLNQGKVIFTYKTFPAETLKTNTVSFTVLGVPCYITVSVQPKYLFGQADQDSAKVTVTVEDTLHTVLQDPVTVSCTTDLGTFSNGLKTITLTTSNGTADTYLHSATVQNEQKTATIAASVSKATGEIITASAEAIMYPGAVTGIVLDGQSQAPLQGAIAIVTDQANNLAGTDTTAEDGAFFIPLDKKVTMYHLQIIVRDKYGDTVVSYTDIDASKFPRPAERISNVIAGRIQFIEGGRLAAGSGVNVYLDSIPRIDARIGLGRKLSSIASTHMRVQFSDEKGRFKFDNLPPAMYQISVDSTKFQNFTGTRVIADTISGVFTINLSIDVTVDSLIDLRLNAPGIALAGDTLRYSVFAGNAGNLNRYNAAIVDTLPSGTRAVSMQRGTFTSAAYDSATRIARWTIDTLAVNTADSASVAVIVSPAAADSSVIRNTVWYTAPGERTRFSSSAATTVRARLGIQFASYFSGRDSIAAGDSVRKVYIYRNTGADSLRGIAIVDTLYGAGRSTASLLKGPGIVAVRDSVITLSIGAIAPAHTDTITIKIETDRTLAPGSRISSSAWLMKYSALTDSAYAVLPIIDKRTWTSPLKVVKTANKKVAEIGDVVTYQVQLSNASAGPLHGVGVYDLLPHAFTYVKNSARYNGRALEPARNPAAASGLTWTSPDTIGASGTATLVYQLALGADALQSEGMNTVTASGETRDGLLLVSDPSQWQVTVKAGVFTEKGLIIGKVFYDDNRNSYQEEGENGIKDVELWMEDGTRITTGDGGKYSVPEIKPGQHVLRVNERTLPPGTQLLGGPADFAKDPVSRFVRVTESGIAKANFFVRRNLSDSLARTAVRALRSLAIRQAIPKYIFKGSRNTASADTVEMIVSFTFKGDKFLQRIEVDELLPSGFRYVENSASFNGRAFAPVIKGDSLYWSLGRASASFSGSLRYKTVVTTCPKPLSALSASSVVRLMTSDSVFVISSPLVTENVVKETGNASIASSSEITTFVHPASQSQRADTAVALQGDELRFATLIRVDAHKQPRSVTLIDSLDGSFAIDESSFMVNGVPVQPGIASVRAARKGGTSVVVSSVDLMHQLKNGMNVVSYIARVQRVGGDTVFTTTSRMDVVDQYGDSKTVSSGAVRIVYRTTPLEVLHKEQLSVKRDSTARHAALTPPLERKPARESMKEAVRTIAEKIAADRIEKLKPPPANATRTDSIPKKPQIPKTALKKAQPRSAWNFSEWMVYKRAPGLFKIQISSWETREKAQVLSERFASATGRGTEMREHMRDGKKYYAVQFGVYKTYDEAQAVIDEFAAQPKSKVNATPILVTDSHGRK